MRKNLLIVGCVASAVFGAMWAGSVVQGQNGAVTVSQVALVDLGQVFKKYEKFNRLTEEMQAEARKKEEEVKALDTEYRDTLKQIKAQTPDSSLSIKLQADATKKKAELDATAQNAQREFTRRQATVLHQTYKEVEDAVRVYAESRGLTLVLRTLRSNEAISGSNPNEVLQEMNRPVVYSHPALDITDAIVSMLNRAAGGAAPVVGPKPTQGVNKNVQKPGSGGQFKR